MHRPASLISAVLLIIIAIGHLLRIMFSVGIVAGSMEIPMLPSVLAMIITGLLGIWLLKE